MNDVLCCWCQSRMIWGSDFSYEDYAMDGEGIVAFFSCTNCRAVAEFYCPIDVEEVVI